MKKINHNDLSHWFLRDHSTLPRSYVQKTQKFFDELQASGSKQQATSSKHATNCRKAK
jgi:hypothetical protein